ncbi:hypothetical protein ACHAWF_013667 [Thalassiosira exigua]
MKFRNSAIAFAQLPSGTRLAQHHGVGTIQIRPQQARWGDKEVRVERGPGIHISLSAQILPDEQLNSQIISEGASAVLSTQDIVVGTVIAFVLAFGYSFLNGQSTSSSFISWPSQARIDNNTLSGDSTAPDSYSGGDRVFNEEDWGEIGREENYILYNTKLRQKREESSKRTPLQNANKKENRLVLAALLVLFVPIFSVEFFFALSRQFVCEMGVGGELVGRLCSPI